MSPLDPAEFLATFRSEAKARGFEIHPLTETSAGPLLGFTLPGNGPPAYLSAGIHGDEPAGCLAALELLRSGFFNRDLSWSICPALNPTGLAAGTRETAEGDDLNRDYLLRTTPEIRAHAAWLEGLPLPERFISLHEDWEAKGFYFYEINLGEDTPQRAEAILAAVRPVFPPESSSIIDDHEVRTPGWIYHEGRADLPNHWPEAIFLAKRGCPLSFTFETPSCAALKKRIAAHIAAVQTASQAP